MATDFGTDTFCLDALVPGRLVSGVEIVAQNQYHRLTTPQGTLGGGDDEEDFGFDLLGECGRITNAAERAALPGRISNECLKDPRVLSCVVTLDYRIDPNTGAATYTFRIDSETEIGPFANVLGVDGVSVALLGLETSS